MLIYGEQDLIDVYFLIQILVIPIYIMQGLFFCGIVLGHVIMKDCVISYSGHYVKVVGVDSNGNIYVKDSNQIVQFRIMPEDRSYRLFRPQR
jgi:hypothetical protein